MNSASAPHQTLTYMLTATDALVWEKLPREASGWGRIGLLLWLGLAGFALAAVPAEWVGPEGGWRFYLWLIALIGVQWGLAILFSRLLARWRARRRFPEPQQVRLDVWPTKLVERRGLGEPVILNPETIHAVILKPDHVIIAGASAAIIVPRTSFADETAMRDFAKHWDDISAQASP